MQRGRVQEGEPAWQIGVQQKAGGEQMKRQQAWIWRAEGRERTRGRGMGRWWADGRT